MPDEKEKSVPIDTSGPDATVDIEEVKDEAVIEQPEQETGTDKTYENERETKLDEKKSDENLEDYSKGVQSRIAKLTRKMREAERREQAATEYARAVEAKRKFAESKYEQINNDYVKQFDTRVTSGMESAQKELAMAIEAGDAAAQVEANKKIATLSIDAARLNVLKNTNEKQVETPKACT